MLSLSIFFQKLEIILWPLLWPKNPNLKKIVDLKVYGNLNPPLVNSEDYLPTSLLGKFLGEIPIIDWSTVYNIRDELASKNDFQTGTL